MKRLYSLFLLVSAALFLTACAPAIRYYRPDPSNPVYTVAVLPMYNVTNDVGGAERVREEFEKRLAGRQYSVLPIKEVDLRLLDSMGITLGDQLELTTPQLLGEALGVDGVVYGYLLDFDDITTGLYNVKKVRAAFKLVETRSGSVIWARALGVKSVIAGGDVGAGVTAFKEIMDAGRDGGVTDAIAGLQGVPGLNDWRIIRVAKTQKPGEAAAIALGEKIITKAIGYHLMLEASDMLNIITRDFPIGPGAARVVTAPVEPVTAPGVPVAPQPVGSSGPADLAAPGQNAR